jgi:hypothetical protein
MMCCEYALSAFLNFEYCGWDKLLAWFKLGYGIVNRSLIIGQHLGFLQLGYLSGLSNSCIN